MCRSTNVLIYFQLCTVLVDARVTSQAAFIGRANQKRQLSNAAIAVEIVDACHHCMRS